MELWDACDQSGQKLGYDLVRGEPLPAGVYHVVAEIAVRHSDGSILLTRRDLSKPNYPGCWEMGAGGSVLKGEGWLEGALRELREETGIMADTLEPLFVTQGERTHCVYAGYLCRYGGPKDAITLQPGETIGYRWLTSEELLAFSRDPSFVNSHRTRWYDFMRGAAEGI